MKIKGLGLPYMGGKRKIAPKIVDYILAKNPNVKYVYDLFGGGGAMSFEFLQRKQIKKVIYNELNTGVCELLKKIRDDGVTPEFYKWISRDDFNHLKNGNDWKAGLIKTCWSFGNNQKDYLFSRELEEPKRLLHEIIVNRCKNSIKEFYNLKGFEVDYGLLQNENINKRRLLVINSIKKSIGRFDFQQLEHLEQLERLQLLEQLERLEQLEQLEIQNKSAFDVIIDTPINETIIYLDPPYFNTQTYENKMCHAELYEYIAKSPFKIYMSSYESDLECVLEVEHRSTLCATANNKTVEKLFCNREDNLVKLTLF